VPTEDLVTKGLLNGTAAPTARIPFEPGGSFFLEDVRTDTDPQDAEAIVRVIDGGNRWRHWTALVVEDEKLDGVPLLKSLKQAGIGKVVWAKTAYGALYQLMEDKDLFPDVLVIDASLVGAGGLRMMRRVRASDDPKIRAIPIIVTTTDPSEGIYERSSRFEVSAYLRKPIGTGNMFEALVRASEGHKIPRAWTYENVERNEIPRFNLLAELVFEFGRVIDAAKHSFAARPVPAPAFKIDMIA